MSLSLGWVAGWLLFVDLVDLSCCFTIGYVFVAWGVVVVLVLSGIWLDFLGRVTVWFAFGVAFIAGLVLFGCGIGLGWVLRCSVLRVAFCYC